MEIDVSSFLIGCVALIGMIGSTIHAWRMQTLEDWFVACFGGWFMMGYVAAMSFSLAFG